MKRCRRPERITGIVGAGEWLATRASMGAPKHRLARGVRSDEDKAPPSGETVTVPSVDFSGGRTETRMTGVSTGARRRDEMTNGSAARSADEQNAGLQSRADACYSRSRRERSQAVSVWPEPLAVPERLSIAKARSLAE